MKNACLEKSSDTKKNISFTVLLAMLVAPIILSVPLHFLHNFINCPFIALFSPVNESVAEHAKIIIYPVVISSVILFFVLRRATPLDPKRFFTAGITNALTAEYFMVTMFYFIFYALGVPSALWAHIVLEVISMTIGLILGYHIYKYGNPKYGLPIVVTMFSITVILMSIFTFLPPNVPLFIS